MAQPTWFPHRLGILWRDSTHTKYSLHRLRDVKGGAWGDSAVERNSEVRGRRHSLKRGWEAEKRTRAENAKDISNSEHESNMPQSRSIHKQTWYLVRETMKQWPCSRILNTGWDRPISVHLSLTLYLSQRTHECSINFRRRNFNACIEMVGPSRCGRPVRWFIASFGSEWAQIQPLNVSSLEITQRQGSPNKIKHCKCFGWSNTLSLWTDGLSWRDFYA